MTYTLSTEQLRNIIQGKYKFYPCLECNGGTVLVDGNTGHIVSTPVDEYTYIDNCNDCHGLGGRIEIE